MQALKCTGRQARPLWRRTTSRAKALALACLLCPAAQSQTQADASSQHCDPSIQPASTPTARFIDHGDGTVTDNGPAQLMWMRCAAGQHWRGGTCEGTASLHNWAQAQALAQRLNDSGEQFFNDWRVPSLRELALVSERQCRHPRINLEVFPASPATTFWTGSSSARQPAAAYALDFGSAGVVQASRDSQHAVRLVRSAP